MIAHTAMFDDVPDKPTATESFAVTESGDTYRLHTTEYSEPVTVAESGVTSVFPLEGDDFPLLVRIPCDVARCPREAYTTLAVQGMGGRMTLCAVHRSRLQLVLLRFLDMDSASAKWREWMVGFADDVLTHSSPAIKQRAVDIALMASASVTPSQVTDPFDWLCERCGGGMSGTAALGLFIHKCNGSSGAASVLADALAEAGG